MPSSSRIVPVALAAWLSLVAAGFAFAWRYESQPGKAAVRRDWPAASRLALDAARPTVVVFAHPSCPCTKASLEGLAGLASRYPGKANWTVVIVGAPGLEGSLESSDNVRLAKTIPGVRIVLDPKAVEARRFGAETSGQTFAYTLNGVVAFRGGVTAVRGHFGPSRGLESLEALLEGHPHPAGTAPVYGCALRESAQ